MFVWQFTKLLLSPLSQRGKDLFAANAVDVRGFDGWLFKRLLNLWSRDASARRTHGLLHGLSFYCFAFAHSSPNLELPTGVEPVTSSLPRTRSTN